MHTHTDIKSIPEQMTKLGELIKELRAAIKIAPDVYRGASPELLDESGVKFNCPPDAVKSAVLILFLEHSGNIFLVLTRRPNRVGPNLSTAPGEIVPPGGKGLEPAIDTALRETFEEIGLRVERECVLGELPPFTLELSRNFWVTPVVAVKQVSSLEFTPDPKEVAEVILTPIHYWRNRPHSSSPLFSVNDEHEHCAAGSAFTLEMLRRGLAVNEPTAEQSDRTRYRTSSEWWQELKTSPARRIDWLRKQYHGELLASRRVAKFRDDSVGTEWFEALDVIAQQEAKHAAWVGTLLKARGIEPRQIEKDERYWNITMAGVDTFKGLAATAAHAERMRLERIKVICCDPATEPDIRAVFSRILPEETFHVRAFTRMAGDTAMRDALSRHEKGMAAINVAMESQLIPFS
jgi:8-oxo-dGTP pyrophosphatase MutT (NUDIX family)/rubrerythrin